MNIARFRRLRLAHLPTPLEHLPNLTRVIGGPEIWMKRDDCTGMSTGGNKTRKLEFLMAEAVDQGANMILTQGATQSNHARQTAACAARLGLRCHILLEDRTGKRDRDYTQNGNVLLDLLHGATIAHCPGRSDMNAELEKAAARCTADGHKTYVIPGGGSNPTGALGYVNMALELITQANDLGLQIDHIVHATGSSGTQAGLVVGVKGCGADAKLLGIGVRAPKAVQEANVFKLASLTAQKIGRPDLVQPEDVVANCDYIGQGYGFPAPDTIEAITLLARLEGILLDPVYSAKGMAGLIDLCRKGYFKKGENVVFVHTGGSAALFGYLSDLAAAPGMAAVT